MAAHDTGVLAATTAFGKTVVAAWLIAQRGVNTLVLVHRQQLLEQWVERLAMFLDVPAKSIGRLGGGTKERSPAGLTWPSSRAWCARGSCMIVSGLTATWWWMSATISRRTALNWSPAAPRRAYVTGLSASTTRKDGHQPIIFMQCGPVRYRDNARQQAAPRPFTHHVLVRPTGFRAPDLPSTRIREPSSSGSTEALTQTSSPQSDDLSAT